MLNMLEKKTVKVLTKCTINSVNENRDNSGKLRKNYENIFK